MGFILGVAVGLAVGWLLIPRPAWVDELVAKWKD